MTGVGGGLTMAALSVTAGPLSMWTVLLIAGWLVVLLFVWLLLVASGRRAPA